MFIRILISLLITCIPVLGQGYVCAVGGESENYNSWSDAPYSWIVQKSDSGKIIVLSVNSETDWIPNYFKSFGASSAYNKRINSRTLADLQSTYDELITAKAIFIKGGDQWNYLNYWKGTKTESAIYHVFNNGGVIAGTSAGTAVFGDLDFTAKYGSAYPQESLINPFGTKIDFDNNFLNLVPGVIFDSHFIERGRFGRLIPFVIKSYLVNQINSLGIGVDGRTALCIDKNGIGTVMGGGSVVFVQVDGESFLERSGSYYTASKLKCDFLVDGWQFDLNSRSISYIPPSAKDVDTSGAWQYPLSDIWLTGLNNVQSNVNISLSSFLDNVNTSRVLVVDHPGYTSSSVPLTDNLSSRGINYSLFHITVAGLNDPVNRQKIDEASAFILLGDSLQILTLLKDTLTLCGGSFSGKLDQNTPCLFFGNAGKSACGNYVDNIDSYSNSSYSGYMRNNQGIGIFSDLIFQPLVWNDSDYYQNRVSALFWGLMHNRKRLGIFLNDNDYAHFNAAARSISTYGPSPIFIVDARQTSKVDSSKFIASSGYRTRQCVAMNNLRISVSTIAKNYSVTQAGIITKTGEQPENTPVSFKLYDNYPNPFNSGTIISWRLGSPEFVSLKIYDILGNEVATLVNELLKEGDHRIVFDGTNSLSSGIYFYRLSTASYYAVKKMVLMK